MFDEANIAAAISACASEGWTDAARNDAVADEFSTALEEICATYNFGRCDDSEATDALVSLASLALSRDASAVASAVDHRDMSDATKKLLDVIGVEIFTPLTECADAVDDQIAEACACALVDACAEACGPRDMFVMALGALQSRVERAAKDLDGDDDEDDDDGHAGHHEPSVRHRGWRLTGAICAGLATSLRRAKNPASLAPDAIPIVTALASLCGRCARFVAETETPGGSEPARHHGPDVGYRGVGEFFKVATNAMHGERAGGHALADGMRALALDPRRLFRPTPRGRLCVHPDHEWVLRRLGTLDHLLSFTTFATNDETDDLTSDWLAKEGDEQTRTNLATRTTSHVAAALIAWSWLVEAEERTPWPSIVHEGSPLGDGCTSLTLANIAPGLSRRPAWRARPAVACLFRREKTTTPLFARAEGEKARRRIFRRVRVGQDFPGEPIIEMHLLKTKDTYLKKAVRHHGSNEHVRFGSTVFSARSAFSFARAARRSSGVIFDNASAKRSSSVIGESRLPGCLAGFESAETSSRGPNVSAAPKSDRGDPRGF